MLGLVGLAISLVPDLIRLIGGDSSNTLATKVSQAVNEVTGTPDEHEARQRLQDPKVTAALQVRLAELALAAQKTQSEAEAAQRRLEIEEVKGVLAQDRIAAQAESERQKSALDTLRASLADTQNARATFADLATHGSDFAWGAPVVSVITALGFFGVLGFTIFRGSDIPESSKAITYTLVGTMATAFATMISFWLGSSQGSRNKDVANRQLQLTNANQTSSLIARLQPKEATRPASADQGAVATVAKAASGDDFVACLHEVLCLEGGYSNDPRDPGGPTNFGITRAELADVRQVPISSITPADMQDLKLREAEAIYRKRYWNAMRCDDLARGVDLMVFQFGVNAGIDESAKVLQRACGATADGIIGNLTLAAANAMQPTSLIQSLAVSQLACYRTFNEWNVYGDGWTNRVDNARKAALAMAA